MINAVFQHAGHTFKWQSQRDNDMGAPWVEHDGHGPVSEFTTRAKKPGELVLATSRGRKRYYDYAAAIKQAKEEGWDAMPYNPQETKGQRAHKAVMADFEYLRKWSADLWEWKLVEVYRLGVEDGEWYYVGCLGGIDGMDQAYMLDAAKDIAAEHYPDTTKVVALETINNTPEVLAGKE